MWQALYEELKSHAFVVIAVALDSREGDALPWIDRIIQADAYGEDDRVTNAHEMPMPSIKAAELGAIRISQHSVETHSRIRLHGDTWGDVNNHPSPAIGASDASRSISAQFSAGGWIETDISRFAIGAEWDRMKPGEKSDKYLNLVKPDPNKPCATVTALGG